jgi:hypothetical protein
MSPLILAGQVFMIFLAKQYNKRLRWIDVAWGDIAGTDINH